MILRTFSARFGTQYSASQAGLVLHKLKACEDPQNKIVTGIAASLYYHCSPPTTCAAASWKYCLLHNGKKCLKIQNNSSLQLESGYSEEENLEGKLFMPRKNFHFPRFERSKIRQSKSRKMEILSRHGKLPERFSSEE